MAEFTAEQLAVLADWDEEVEQRDPQFNGYNGHWSITICLRSVVAWHPGISRRDFLAVMKQRCNEQTLRIQFAQSRKHSVEWFGDVELPPDGRLAELA